MTVISSGKVNVKVECGIDVAVTAEVIAGGDVGVGSCAGLGVEVAEGGLPAEVVGTAMGVSVVLVGVAVAVGAS